MIRIALTLLFTAGLSTALGADERPLMCFGTEPFWSVDLTEPGVAQFSMLDGPDALFRGAPNRLDFLGETLWRGSTEAGSDLVVWMKDSACSDNMSDTQHPVTARVSLPGGEFLAGCCRLVSQVAGEKAAFPLEGPVWQLAEISSAGPASLAGLARPVTVQFEGGRAQGFSGCNNFTGGYVLEGNMLRLGQPASTMMACVEEEMSLENTFQRAFSGDFEYSVVEDRLLMSAPSGQTLMFTRMPPPQLEGSSWNVTNFNNNRQAVVGVVGGSELTLEFDEQEVSGSAGCNRFRATYSTDGSAIVFGPVVTTRMACEAPILTQEQEFLAALASAVSWRIDGNVLDMHRADSERAIWAISR